MRKPRRLRIVVSVALVLAATLVGFAWFLVSTDAGARVVVRFARGRLPEGLTIGAVHGNLRGPLTIDDIAYRDETTSATIDTTIVDWRLFALLRRRIDLREVQLAGVEVTMAPAPETAADTTPLTDFRPPYGLVLERAVVRRLAVILTDTDSIYRADSIVIGESEFRDRLRVSSVEVSTPVAHATLSLSVETSGRYPLDASFAWSAPVQGYSLAGTGTASGDLDSLEINHHLTAPTDLRLRATVRDILGDLTFGATLNVAEFATADIDSTLTPALVSAGFATAGTPAQFTTTGRLDVTEERIGRVEALLRATVEDTVVRLDSLQLRFPDHSGRIDLVGLVRRGTAEIEGGVGVAWRDVNWPITGPSRLSSRGRGQLQFRGSNVAFDIVTTLAGLDVPTGEIRIRGEGNDQRLRFAGSGSALGGSIVADGIVDWQPVVAWRAGFTARRLDLTPFVEDSSLVPRDVAVRVRVTGRVEADSFVSTVVLDSARAVVRDLPVFASATVRVGPGGLELDTATVRLLEGTVGLSGRVAWVPEISWSLALGAGDIAPATLLPVPADWPGALNTTGFSTGRLTASGADLTLRVDTLWGNLRGQTVGGKATVGYGRDRVRVPQASLDWGTLRFRASGELGTELVGQLELRVPDLSASLPDAGGALTLEAEFGGDRRAPRVQATLTGDSLRYGDMQIRTIRTLADLDFAAGGELGLALQSEGIAAGDRYLEMASIDLAGNREDHDFVVRLSGPDLETDLGGTGTLGTDTWRAHITDLEIGGRPGVWTLRSAVPVELSRTDAVVGRMCFDGEGTVCGSGAWSRAGPWSGTVDGVQIPLAYLAGYLGSDIDVAGPVDVSGSLGADAEGYLAGDVAVRVGPGEILYRARTERRRIVFDRSAIDVGIGADGVRLDWVTSLQALEGDSTPTRIAGYLALPDYRRLDDSLPPQRIAGQVRAAIDDFSALEAINPYLVDPAGTLRLDIAVDGTVERPRLLGNGQLRGIRADIPLLGLELRDGSLDLTGDDEGVTLTGEMRSGAGVLSIAGRSSGQLAADTAVTIRLYGSNLQVAATTEAQIRASPDLLVNAGRGWMAIDGEVLIPWATIELREIPAIAVPTSRDVVYIGDTTLVAADEMNISTRVRLTLGDSVSFRGFGFTVQPKGSILAIDEPGQVTTGTGQLILDGGRYRAYGQDLTIESGRVLFAGGPIDNPGFDVRAIRRARDSTVVGLAIRGTLREPEVTIFSEPPMLQSDAFAYLLIGRPLAEASASEGSRLTRAARSLGLRGGNLLAQRIGARFGLDDFRIEAEDSWEGASFLAGKYLSPRLYVAYSLGLFQSTGLLRVRYLLSSKWTLQAETGDGTATDIFYRIERGR